MSSATVRDTERVLAGFVEWLGNRQAESTFELVGHRVPEAGLSNTTYLVDVARIDATGRHDEHVVVKLAPDAAATFPSYDFELQAHVHAVVAAAGVPAPVPAVAEADPRWTGAPFLVMPAIRGHVIDEMPIRDPWITDASPEENRGLHERYVDVVADINRIDWRSAGLGAVVECRDNDAELAYWHRYLDWYADGAPALPALVAAMAWCETNRPATEPEPSLLWGDVRLGNIIHDDRRRQAAIIDWEMTTIGAAEHDLAWMVALQDTQDRLVRHTVPGFLERDQVIERYEARLGRPVEHLGWYEMLAHLRSTAIMARIAFLDERAGRPVLFPIDTHPVVAMLQRRVDKMAR